MGLLTLAATGEDFGLKKGANDVFSNRFLDLLISGDSDYPRQALWSHYLKKDSVEKGLCCRGIVHCLCKKRLE